MLKYINNFICFIFLSTIFVACTNEDYTPKPKAYPRIILPERVGYETYESNCAYTFEYPKNTEIEIDSFFFDEAVYEKCWFNIVYPTINSKIHISYKKIGEDVTLEKILKDADEMTYKHSRKADFIDEMEIENKHGVKGLIFDVGGDAATNIQFYLTDYEKHYLRGALYFYATPNADSLAPAINYVKEDLNHFFNTFRWK